MNRPTSIPQPPWTDDQIADAIRRSANRRSAMLLLGFGERSSCSVLTRSTSLGTHAGCSGWRWRQAVLKCQPRR